MRVRLICFSLSILLLAFDAFGAASTFRIATYNLNNYIDVATNNRAAKSDASKTKIKQSLLAIKADVVALQEIGTTNALMELCNALASVGLKYPYREHARGHDPIINVAVLSRYPITARRSHTNESFLLYGRRLRVSRAFAEVDISLTPQYSFTLITAHLKSRRIAPEGDEGEIRLEEAKILREIISQRLSATPNLNLVVLGDLNDVKDSPTVRTIMGRGNTALIDTRPAERNGDDQPHENPRFDPPWITWTHYYGKEDSYSRVDYILLSAGMAKEWKAADSFVLATPNWGLGSDHRPVVATFVAENQ
jgi:endonuclease/exonuclease/phosphatase family metal-dependent hydrolase